MEKVEGTTEVVVDPAAVHAWTYESGPTSDDEPEGFRETAATREDAIKGAKLLAEAEGHAFIFVGKLEDEALPVVDRIDADELLDGIYDKFLSEASEQWMETITDKAREQLAAAMNDVFVAWTVSNEYVVNWQNVVDIECIPVSEAT